MRKASYLCTKHIHISGSGIFNNFVFIRLYCFVHTPRSTSHTIELPSNAPRLKDGDGMLDYDELLALASKKKRATGHVGQEAGSGGILSKLKKKVRDARRPPESP